MKNSHNYFNVGLKDDGKIKEIDNQLSINLNNQTKNLCIYSKNYNLFIFLIIIFNSFY